MTRPVSIGKLRGRQQITDPHGPFAMCAMDHRGSMPRLINRADPDRVTAERLDEDNLNLNENWRRCPQLDPLYGLGRAAALAGAPGEPGHAGSHRKPQQAGPRQPD